MKRYKAQRGRGSDGFGFYIPQHDRLTHNAREGRILSLLRRDKSEEVLFHHRFPTSTANVRNACHPFSTKDVFDNNYIVVHNGVLYNEDELKKEHDKLGIKYVSEQESGRFNDSEALTYDIARYLEGHKKGISAEGSIAFIALKRDKSGKASKLFFGRNSGNPLVMKKTKHSITLSSEGKGKSIDANYLYCFDYDTLEVTKRYLYIPLGWSGSYTSSYSTMGKGLSTSYYEDDEFEMMTNTDTHNNATRVRNELMTDTAGDVWYALQLAYERIDTLETRKATLDEVIESSEDNADWVNRNIDEYVEVDDEILFTEIAIERLTREASASTRRSNALGFQSSKGGVK